MIGPERSEAIPELAEILDISRDLIFQALWMLEKKTGYRLWSIPKKPGSEEKRQIQAARWPLNEIQARIAARVYPFSVSEINHSFIGGRSHRTAILSHLKANAFFTFDIKDAFPSTKKTQIKFSFRMIGFKERVADLMADLVCYTPGKSEDGFLPQGYTSSPTVFNLILRGTDRILAGFAKKRGYQISRYVDDFGLSTTAKTIPETERRLAIKLVEDLNLGNFKIPDEKTSYQEAEEGRVHFEFLGLVIEGPADGERIIRVADDKLGEYRWAIQEAMEKGDFSKRKLRELKGKIRYLKSIYKDRPLPPYVFEPYTQYLLMKEVADATKIGQSSLSIQKPTAN